jgi:hypothetical protein
MDHVQFALVRTDSGLMIRMVKAVGYAAIVEQAMGLI